LVSSIGDIMALKTVKLSEEQIEYIKHCIDTDKQFFAHFDDSNGNKLVSKIDKILVQLNKAK
jgi:hypothetical protein